MFTANNFCLSQYLGQILKDQGLRLALAESCTGGGFAREITAVNGSSAWFECSFVTYSNESKMNMLGVSGRLLKQHGAVCSEVAIAMAEGALKNSSADLSLSVTGIAGPSGGTPEKPVGTVYFAIARLNRETKARQGFFAGGRKHVQQESISFGLKCLLEELGKHDILCNLEY